MLIDYSEKIGIKNLKILFNTDDNRPLISKNIISMNQRHSTNSCFVNSEDISGDNDAIFTFDHSVALEVCVADCMPIFLFDNSLSFFGVIHAGWRGLANGIIEKSIMLIKKNNFELKNIKVFIGPSISQKNFEVQSDVLSYFDSKFSTVKDEKIFLSLQQVAIDKFAYHGIDDVIDSKECTYDNLNYHSYRRDKTDKRMKGWIYCDK